MIASLVEKAGWTEYNTNQIVRLTCQHGTITLRKALALAEVLGIDAN